MRSKIRALRTVTGESLSAFSRRLGLNHSAFVQFELMHTIIPPRWRTVLAKEFGVPEDELFDARGFARDE